MDGKRDTRWAADSGVTSAFLEIDLGKPKSFRRARLSEAFPNRVQKFELQYLEGTSWKPFVKGTLIGDSWIRSFPQITAQKVRLAVLESTDGPTIWEFSLFE